jgi:hypothetical protein
MIRKICLSNGEVRGIDRSVLVFLPAENSGGLIAFDFSILG